jgi:hypothetical protein
MRRRLAFYLWRLAPVIVLRALDYLHLTYVRVVVRLQWRLATSDRKAEISRETMAKAMLYIAAWEAKYGEMED